MKVYYSWNCDSPLCRTDCKRLDQLSEKFIWSDVTMATAQTNGGRATAVPVPRNRTRSGSAQFQSKSPPLRSVAELGSSVMDESNTTKPSMLFGEKNVAFASGSSDPHRDAANIGTENPGGSKVPAFLNKLFR